VDDVVDKRIVPSIRRWWWSW